MGMFTLGKEIMKFAVSKGIPADFLISLGKDLEKNPDINIGQRIKNAYGDSVTGQTIKKIKDGFTQFKEKKAMGGMMEARKKGMGLRMANGGEVPSKFKGFSKLPESVQEQMSPTLAKKYEKGGVVKKRVKRTKKSRGTGAAIKGTKFKGVF